MRDYDQSDPNREWGTGDPRQEGDATPTSFGNCPRKEVPVDTGTGEPDSDGPADHSSGIKAELSGPSVTLYSRAAVRKRQFKAKIER